MLSFQYLAIVRFRVHSHINSQISNKYRFSYFENSEKPFSCSSLDTLVLLRLLWSRCALYIRVADREGLAAAFLSTVWQGPSTPITRQWPICAAKQPCLQLKMHLCPNLYFIKLPNFVIRFYEWCLCKSTKIVTKGGISVVSNLFHPFDFFAFICHF